MANLLPQLQSWRLTTAQLLYRMPDHPALLQTYLWQDYDRAPEFPTLRRFLAFWQRELDGPLHSVQVAQAPLISQSEARWVKADYLLN